MTISDAEYKATLGRFATGVAVVATIAEGTPFGLTVNAFASISLDPHLVMISVDRRSHLHDAVSRSGFFAASILAADQEELSRRFAGQTADREDRFHGVLWHAEATGAPVLEGVVSWVDCKVEAMYPGGDHTLMLGRVEALGVNPGEPLLYYRGRYGRLDLPAGAPLRKNMP
jgi:3-hydroxy-9,10-secoandrosta-1,3,5(10)-triene-9,17-dione monooxygenase reductase component